jgi:hypothetical protein
MSQNRPAYRSCSRTDSPAGHCAGRNLSRLPAAGRSPGFLGQDHAILNIGLSRVGADLLIVFVGIQNRFVRGAAGK